MWKVLLASSAIALTNLPASAQAPKNLIFVAEDRGVKIYIHPETIKKSMPNVRFWAYAITPSKTRKNTASDLYITMDCGAQIFRVLHIIRYNRFGNAIADEPIPAEAPPQFLKSLGQNVSQALIKTVCNQDQI
jgi:hypothetical protein